VTTRPTHTEWRTINQETQQKMAYRYLGNTGMKVSIISYGNMTIHDLGGNIRNEETQKFANESVKACFDRGINFFDTAEIYSNGESEKQMGIALKALGVPRKDYVVSTKLLSCGNGVNDSGMSRKHIIEGCRNSLKRLQLDYVDVIFSHRPDHVTPLEEQVRAFSWLIDHGLAHYWGTSEWTAAMIEQACEIAAKYRLHAPQFEQCQYNMMERDAMEVNLADLFKHRNYGTTIWGPVCAGLLTGKYNDGLRPEGTRGALAVGHPFLHDRWEKYLGEANVAKTVKQLQALEQIAKKHEVSQT
jgi:aryl-alcohol dehydrogenase-like predicted oxidoreductase